MRSVTRQGKELASMVMANVKCQVAADAHQRRLAPFTIFGQALAFRRGLLRRVGPALLVPGPDPRHGSKYSVPTNQGMEERCCDVQQDGGEKHVGEHCMRRSQDRVQLVVMW
jgi:hypothetical protein